MEKCSTSGRTVSTIVGIIYKMPAPTLNNGANGFNSFTFVAFHLLYKTVSIARQNRQIESSIFKKRRHSSLTQKILGARQDDRKADERT